MSLTYTRVHRAAACSAVVAALLALTAPHATAQPEQGARTPQRVRMDSARMAELYVSNRHEDHPPADYARQMTQKRRTDSIYAARSRNVMEFRKITYKSRVDGMTIPARCDVRGFLLIGEDAPDLGPYVLPGNNYHVYDYALFWANVRADAAARLAAFKAR